MIIRRLTFNKPGTVISSPYLCIEYLFSDGLVRFIQGDHKIAMRCYVDSLKLKKVTMVMFHAYQPNAQEVNVVDLKP